VSKVHDQIKASAMPKLPLIWSEFNASYKNEPEVTDSVYMGPWLADTIRQCDGLVDIMSYWTFSDVFEEQGVVRTPFYGGFGLIAAGDILKPSFEAFKLLHKLGNRRLDLASNSALVTRSDDGSLVVAVWNYAAPEESGAPRNVTLHFSHVNAQQMQIWRVDADHGDPHAAYAAMGSPLYPTRDQVSQLRAAAQNNGLEIRDFKGGDLQLSIPAKGLVVLQVR
jgi:xylan 1,4-beta-xylosidase